MKYALISDIHANLPALEAVLADIDRRSDVDAIYHLGDLVGYAPWPNEVVALLRQRGIAGIAGNYDSTTGTDYKHCGCKYENPRAGRAVASELRLDAGARLARDEALPRRPAVSPRPVAEGRAHLRRSAPDPRPRHADAQHAVLDRGPSRLVLHPDGWDRRREARRRDRLRTHAQAVAPRGRGRPLPQHRIRWQAEGRRLAGWLRPALDRRRTNRSPEFIRVDYDIERAMAGIRESELPDEFARSPSYGWHAWLAARVQDSPGQRRQSSQMR